MPLKTLFLNPPSFENFDGGAGSRWPATREIESYWYPVWLAYPAGMLEGSRLLDAPPHHVSGDQTIEICKEYRIPGAVHQHSGLPWRYSSCRSDQGRTIRTSRLRSSGRTSRRCPKRSLKMCTAIDFVARNEFDYSVTDFANGKPLEEIRRHQLSQERTRRSQPRCAGRSRISMPCPTWSTSTSAISTFRATTFRFCCTRSSRCIRRAAVPRSVRSACGRKRSADIRGASVRLTPSPAKWPKAKELWPDVKEFFFDDDTFNIQKARTIELCEKLKPLKLTWSCTSRVTTDYDTLKAMKEAGCRLLIVGYESGDPQILKNIKKGATVERARQFTATATNLD